MVEFLADLAMLHVDPGVSNPAKITQLPDDAISEDEKRPNWSKEDLRVEDPWPGLFRDVGIFSAHEWDYIMCKCLSSMSRSCPHSSAQLAGIVSSISLAIPLADAGSLTTSYRVDANEVLPSLDQLPAPEARMCK